MKEDTVIKDKAFGVISLSKCFNGAKNRLFMSSIEDNMTSIRIRISGAEQIINEFGEERVYHDGLPIVEIEMSATQFSEFLLSTKPNGDGTPCTIRRIGKDIIPPISPLAQNKRERLQGFYKQKMKEATEKLMGSQKRVEELMAKKYLTQDEKNEINGIFGMIKMELSANFPFWLEMFDESMGKITTECKQEIDSMFQALVTKTGLESLQKMNNPLAIESKEEE